MAATLRARTAGSVGRSLRTSFGLLLACLLLAGAAGIAALTLQADAATEALDRIGPLRSKNLEIMQDLSDAQTAVRAYVASGSAEMLAPYRRGRDAFAADLEAARALVGDDLTLRRQLDTQETLGKRWLARHAARQLAAGKGGIPADERPATVAFNEFRTSNRHTDALLLVRRDGSRAEVAARAAQGRAVLLAIMLLGVALGALVAARTTRSIVAPLGRLRGTLAVLAKGDTSARAVIEGPAEVEALAASLNVLAAENARLTVRQRELVERERTIREIGGRVREPLDVTGVLTRSVAELGQLLRAQRAYVRLLRGDTLGEVAAEWAAIGVPRLSARPPERLPWELAKLLGEGTVAVREVATDRRLSLPETRSYLLGQGVHALLSAHLLTGRTPKGVIVLHDTRGPRIWADAELEVLEGVAREIGGAISTAEAYERERHMVAKLQDLDNAKSEFVSSVSHELRTPLTSIVGYAELLIDEAGGPLAPEQARMLEVVERNSRRLLTLIEDLLTLSHIESGMFTSSPAPVELAALIDAVLDTIRPSLDGLDLELVVVVADEVGTVLGDPARLERVLINLLTNAVKFSPDGGRITLSARQAADLVEISVTDTGIGIPTGEQHRLFGRFYRTSTAQERAIKGTGLGLVIVKSIVEQHGGTIRVDSAPGRGTTFTFTLPLAPGPEDGADALVMHAQEAS